MIIKSDIINAAYVRLLLVLLASTKSAEQYNAIIDYYVFNNRKPQKYKNLKYVQLDKRKLKKMAFQF